MKRRIAALVLFCSVFLSGCSRSGLLRRSSAEAQPQNAYVSEYERNWAYTCLSDAQKANYGAVYTALRDGLEQDGTVIPERDGEQRCGISVRLPNPMTDEAEIEQLYQAITQDNPAFFYVDTVYGYSGTAPFYDTMTLTYFLSVEERVAAQKKLSEKQEEYLSLLQPSMTDFEKELVLHDALLAQCQYDHDAAANTEGKRLSTAFTAYGALVEGKAVCEGYAHAMQYLLNSAGVEATVVTGFDAQQGEPHMWNAVRLDGKLYYLDPTWDDGETQIGYTYFNVNSGDLTASHRMGTETIGAESTAATEHNYYRMTGHYLETWDQKEIAMCVAAELTAGEGAVHLRFSEDSFDNALFFLQQASWFTETVNACLPVGVAPLQAYQLTYNENYNTAVICKKTS